MKRVTMEDVAREAGVSRALVSVAFRGVSGVGADTRQRIFDTAQRLGYRPDPIAARLASRHTKTLGLFMLDLRNEIFSDIFSGVREVADTAGNLVVLGVGDSSGKRDSAAIEGLIDTRVDAIIVAGCLLPDKDLQHFAKTRPLVAATRYVPGVDSILTDDHIGSKLAVEHLIGQGHQRIAHLAPPYRELFEGRVEGYVATMQAAGLTPVIVRAEYSQDAAARAAGSLLDSQDAPTAVFANNDLAALGIMDAAHERGLRIPEDLAVVGYDDTHAASLPGVALTSVSQHSTRIGRLAAEMALARIKDPLQPSQRLTLEPTLVVRASSTARAGRTRNSPDQDVLTAPLPDRA